MTLQEMIAAFEKEFPHRGWLLRSLTPEEEDYKMGHRYFASSRWADMEAVGHNDGYRSRAFGSSMEECFERLVNRVRSVDAQLRAESGHLLTGR